MAAKKANATSYGGIQGNKPKGNDQKRPGPGVPPEAFRTRMQLIASRTKTAKNLEKILDDADHSQFMKALEFAADRGYGKVPQAVTGPEGGPLTIKIIRDAE